MRRVWLKKLLGAFYSRSVFLRLKNGRGTHEKLCALENTDEKGA